LHIAIARVNRLRGPGNRVFQSTPPAAPAATISEIQCAALSAVRVLRRAAELDPGESRIQLPFARSLADARQTGESKVVMELFRPTGSCGEERSAGGTGGVSGTKSGAAPGGLPESRREDSARSPG